MTIYSVYLNEKGSRRFKFFHFWYEYHEFFFTPLKTILSTKIFDENGKEVN